MREEEKESIKKLLKYVIIVVVFILIGSFIYNNFIKDGGSKFSQKYIIFGNYLIYQKVNGGFKQIKELNDDILKLKFNITDGTTTKQNVTMQYHDRKWYFFDKDYNQITMDDFKVATHDYNVQLASYERENYISALDDENIINFLKSENIANTDTYYGSYISCDLDHDGSDEYIYTVANYSLEATDYDQKGFIFGIKNDKIIKLSKKERPYTVMEVADLDNDSKYELIVNKGNIDIKQFDSCYQIYSLKNNKFELIKDCK